MAERPILMWPDDVLSQCCEPVDAKASEIAALIKDLFDTMYDAKGRGLAAPQIGVAQRVFVVDVTWKEAAPEPMAFINPEIIGQSDVCDEVMEQCLSIPQLPMPVTRPTEISLSWDTVSGVRETAHFAGDAARCIQHEFDHLNGTVIFDHQSPEDRATLEAAYAP